MVFGQKPGHFRVRTGHLGTIAGQSGPKPDLINTNWLAIYTPGIKAEMLHFSEYNAQALNFFGEK